MRSRRAFLGQGAMLAGATAAGPLILPGRVFGAGGAAVPSERLGLGIIGVGGRGSSHLNALKGVGDVEIRAVCDPFRSKREKAKATLERQYAKAAGKATYRGCGVYSDFRELLARDDIDAVVVASPEYWHALHMTTAVRAGKDVYGEKALSLTVAEGRTLCRAVRRYRSVLQVGTQQRSGGNFRFACELARNGYLGTLKNIRVGVPGGRALPNAPPAPVPADLDYEMWLGPAPWSPYNKLKCSFNWYFIYDYCIGWIGSWGVHHVDIALWGAPALGRGQVQVAGSATFPEDGLANTSVTWHVQFRTPDGLTLSFADNRRPGHSQGCRFEGSEGWVHVNRGGISAQPASLLKTRIKPDEEHLYESRNHHGNFIECIRSRRDPVAPVEAGHAATTATSVADIATRLGRPLTWDWAAERFVDDESANRLLSRPMRSPWRL